MRFRSGRVRRSALKRPAVFALALLLGLGFVACGKDGDGSSTEAGGEPGLVPRVGKAGGDEDLRQASNLLRSFFGAVAAQDWAEACSYLAKHLRNTVEERQGEDCEGFLTAQSDQLPAPGRGDEKLEVETMRVMGSGGIAVYRISDGTARAIPLKREMGRWKVAATMGLPVGQ